MLLIALCENGHVYFFATKLRLLVLLNYFIFNPSIKTNSSKTFFYNSLIFYNHEFTTLPLGRNLRSFSLATHHYALFYNQHL